MLLEIYRRQPWGERLADWRSAMQAHTTAQSMGGKTKLNDFLPRFRPAEQTPEQSAKALERWALKHNSLLKHHRPKV
uniref:phage tail assembly protein T n=1 Tax=Zavarzinella formosa TaxID=360055 RepID=UPI0036F20725